MARRGSALFAALTLLVLLASSFATEFGWNGELQLNEHSSLVVLEAGRAPGGDEGGCAQQTNVAVTLKTSITGSSVVASVYDGCGGAALVPLGLLKLDKAGNEATWIGTAIWAGVPCKSSNGGLSVKVGLASGIKSEETITLRKCSISIVCVSSEASSVMAFANEKRRGVDGTSNALTHSTFSGLVARSRVRRAVCGGLVAVNLTARPFVFGSNLDLPNYNPYMDCSWDLTAPPDAVVYLRFTAFSTEGCCDIIYVHNGDINAPLFPGGQHGGSALLGPFLSSGSLMRVDFQSDKNVQGSGFIAEATSRFICRPGRPVTATVNNTIIATGGPGSTYPNAVSCTWLLIAPATMRAKITFTSFATQATDTLSVYDGAAGNVLFGVLSGSQLPSPIVSTGTTLRFIFTSDSSLTMAGFDALFTFTNEPASALSPCTAQPPPTTQGSVTACIGTPSGANCTPECNPGFAPVGAYACYGGAWSGTASCPVSPCFTVPAVSFGETTHCAGLASGLTCTPTCDAGYNRTGRFTCSSGTWSGSASCNPNACTTVPPPIANGNVTGCLNKASGGTCAPTCEVGFTVSSHYTCQLGQWIGQPTCQANACSSAAPAVSRGSTLGCAGTQSGSECVPSCDNGHAATGKFLCTAGVWSGAASCLPIPCNLTPPAIPNGNVSACSGLSSGGSCAPTCADGHVSSGAYTCTAGGWVGAPVCQASPCASLPPSVTNGSVTGCINMPSGTTCAPTCQPGFSVLSHYFCYLGRWTGQPMCLANSCTSAPPSVARGSTLGCVGTQSGLECAPTCDSGYLVNGSYLCTAATWTGSASCSPIPCDVMPSSVANGNVSACVGHLSGSSCAPVCDVGFLLSGAFTCSAGIWTGTPTCQALPCPTPPSVAQGSVTACAGTPSGDTCTPTCTQGHTPVGTLSCYATQWRGNVTCQPFSCFTAPAVSFGDAMSCAGMASGSTCMPECDTGYTRSGRFTCFAGTWSGTATCLPSACSSPPPAVSDGLVTGCVNTPSGATCSPLCQPGYTAVNQFSCYLGRWLGVAACRANACASAAPAVSRGSTLGCAGTQSGSECVPSCESGHAATGKFLCSAGVWSGAASCLPIPCNVTPPLVANGNVSACAGLTSGSDCAPVCATGYLAIGAFQCTAGGWAGAPVCQATPCTSTPPSVAQGSVASCANTQSGAQCTPVCQTGFDAAGSYSCSLGAWSGTPSCVSTATARSGSDSSSSGFPLIAIIFACVIGLLVLILLVILVVWYRRRRKPTKLITHNVFALPPPTPPLTSLDNPVYSAPNTLRDHDSLNGSMRSEPAALSESHFGHDYDSLRGVPSMRSDYYEVHKPPSYESSA